MRNPILDDIAKLMTDAAGVAQGMRKEVEVATTGLLERWLAEQNIPTGEEVAALRESVRLADEEREALAARVAALEAALAVKQAEESAEESPTEESPQEAPQEPSGAHAEPSSGEGDATHQVAPSGQETSTDSDREDGNQGA